MAFYYLQNYSPWNIAHLIKPPFHFSKVWKFLIRDDHQLLKRVHSNHVYRVLTLCLSFRKIQNSRGVKLQPTKTKQIWVIKIKKNHSIASHCPQNNSPGLFVYACEIIFLMVDCLVISRPYNRFSKHSKSAGYVHMCVCVCLIAQEMQMNGNYI